MIFINIKKINRNLTTILAVQTGNKLNNDDVEKTKRKKYHKNMYVQEHKLRVGVVLLPIQIHMLFFLRYCLLTV